MHSVKYAYIEVYFSINNENILELSKRMTTKSLGGLWPVYQSLLMANLICYRPDKNVNFFVLIPCLVLILRKEPFLIKSSSTTEENVLQARAFAELISHIEGNVDNGTYMFRLSELHSLYVNCWYY